jgi:hypothetical protein
MGKHVLSIAAALLFFISCSERSGREAATAVQTKAPARGMTITSPAFATNQEIPGKYGCTGTNTSPPLSFAGVPAGAKSLALVVEDPDAPGGLFTHWVVWNIPTTTTTAAEGQPPAGGTEGMSGYGKAGWGPPCPPSGEHRYVFNLFAIDAELTLPPSTGREELLSAMKNHVLAQAELTGRYRR